jgi:uncharacterized repeat protein (TIGR03843 family)
VIDTADGHVHGVDHGICFHVEEKLRTVLWGWAGEPLPASVRDTLSRLAAALGDTTRAASDGGLGAALSEHLTGREVTAVGARIATLLKAGRFPLPRADRPAVPWPPI